MPLIRRNIPRGRYGQPTLDPSRPLYVRRRLSTGGGQGIAPGTLFDASSVPPARLALLYRGGFLSHEPPKTPAASPVAAVVERALARAAEAAPAPIVAPQAPAPPPTAEPTPAPVLEQVAPVVAPPPAALPAVAAKPPTPTPRRHRS
jgi:hypothetical protein